MMRRAALTYRFEQKISPYSEALRLVGIEPVLVTPSRPLSSVAEVDGLVVSGGTDINPRLYGQVRDSRSDDPDDERDDLERRLILEALTLEKPIFAICRGLQLFNVVHPGGELFQHIEGHAVTSSDRSLPAHSVAVEGGTLLAGIMGAGEHRVNSRHHQAVSQPGAGLVVASRAADGTIEALENPQHRFAIAVQWHPEDQVHTSATQKRLFQAFAAAL